VAARAAAVAIEEVRKVRREEGIGGERRVERG